jgi:protein TonB
MKYLFLALLISCSIDLLAQIPSSKDKPSKDSLTVEDAPDTDPQYIGGFESLSKYLNDSLRWDEVLQWQARKKKPMANKVLVRFVIEKNGTISHVEVESATIKCPPCKKEAIRVIQAMPAWIPGYKHDRPVRTWVRIPIIFKVDE